MLQCPVAVAHGWHVDVALGCAAVVQMLHDWLPVVVVRCPAVVAFWVTRCRCPCSVCRYFWGHEAVALWFRDRCAIVARLGVPLSLRDVPLSLFLGFPLSLHYFPLPLRLGRPLSMRDRCSCGLPVVVVAAVVPLSQLVLACRVVVARCRCEHLMWDSCGVCVYFCVVDVFVWAFMRRIMGCSRKVHMWISCWFYVECPRARLAHSGDKGDA